MEIKFYNVPTGMIQFGDSLYCRLESTNHYHSNYIALCILALHDADQLTYTAPEVENLKRSFPSGYAYETRACEVGAVQNAHFTVALGVIF